MASDFNTLSGEFRGLNEDYRTTLGVVGLHKAIDRLADEIDPYQGPGGQRQDSRSLVAEHRYDFQDGGIAETTTELGEYSQENLVALLRAETFDVYMENALRDIVIPLAERLELLSLEERLANLKNHQESTFYQQEIVSAIDGLKKDIGDSFVRRMILEYRQFQRNPVWSTLRAIDKLVVSPVTSLAKTLTFGFKKDKTDGDRIVEVLTEIKNYLMLGQVYKKPEWWDRLLRGGAIGSTIEAVGGGVLDLAGMGRKAAQRAEIKAQQGIQLNWRDKAALLQYRDEIIQKGRDEGAGLFGGGKYASEEDREASMRMDQAEKEGAEFRHKTEWFELISNAVYTALTRWWSGDIVAGNDLNDQPATALPMNNPVMSGGAGVVEPLALVDSQKKEMRDVASVIEEATGAAFKNVFDDGITIKAKDLAAVTSGAANDSADAEFKAVGNGGFVQTSGYEDLREGEDLREIRDILRDDLKLAEQIAEDTDDSRKLQKKMVKEQKRARFQLLLNGLISGLAGVGSLLASGLVSAMKAIGIVGAITGLKSVMGKLLSFMGGKAAVDAVTSGGPDVVAGDDKKKKGSPKKGSKLGKGAGLLAAAGGYATVATAATGMAMYAADPLSAEQEQDANVRQRQAEHNWANNMSSLDPKKAMERERESSQRQAIKEYYETVKNRDYFGAKEAYGRLEHLGVSDRVKAPDVLLADYRSDNQYPVTAELVRNMTGQETPAIQSDGTPAILTPGGGSVFNTQEILREEGMQKYKQAIASGDWEAAQEQYQMMRNYRIPVESPRDMFAKQANEVQAFAEKAPMFRRNEVYQMANTIRDRASSGDFDGAQTAIQQVKNAFPEFKSSTPQVSAPSRGPRAERDSTPQMEQRRIQATQEVPPMIARPSSGDKNKEPSEADRKQIEILQHVATLLQSVVENTKSKGDATTRGYPTNVDTSTTNLVLGGN